MRLGNNILTSVSLLQALSAGQSPVDWDRFVRKYVALLRGWAMRWGASRDLADDLVQETLLNVLRSIHDFEYDANGSFRSWLKVVAWRSWRHIEKKEYAARHCMNSGSAVKSLELGLIKNVASRVDLFESFDKLAQAEIFEMACDKVRRDFNESSWQAFQLMELNSRPCKDVAETLGLTVPAVLSAVYRVRKRVIQQASLIDQSS